MKYESFLVEPWGVTRVTLTPIEEATQAEDFSALMDEFIEFDKQLSHQMDEFREFDKRLSYHQTAKLDKNKDDDYQCNEDTEDKKRLETKAREMRDKHYFSIADKDGTPWPVYEVLEVMYRTMLRERREGKSEKYIRKHRNKLLDALIGQDAREVVFDLDFMD